MSTNVVIDGERLRLNMMEIMVNKEWFDIRLHCDFCGHRAHRIERDMFPDLTIGGYITRIVKFHYNHGRVKG